MTLNYKRLIVNFIQIPTSILLITFCLFNTLVAQAQYGGSGNNTITPGNNSNTSSSAPVFSLSSITNGVNLNIQSAIKGDKITANVTNSSIGLSFIQFTLDQNVTNVSLTLTKADPTQLDPGLSGQIIAAFKLSLNGITYDKILNFNIAFIVNESSVISVADKAKGLVKVYTAYSHNSPWAQASINQPTADSNGNLSFNGTSAIAFQEFAVIAKNSNPEVLGVDEIKTTSSSPEALIRTGMDQKSVYLTGTISLLAIMLLVFSLNKSHQKY